MKLYRKIIHPYVKIDDKKCAIEGYKGRWFSEESERIIMNDVYDTYHNDGESKIEFFRRYHLRFDTRYIEISFATQMDHKIEDLSCTGY